MSGPALNPIANTAPVAPAKGTTGPRADAPGQAAETDAPEQGFATELKRRMQGDSKAEEPAHADQKAAAEGDAATPATAESPAAGPVQPELAALLAGMVTPATEPSAAPSRADDKDSGVDATPVDVTASLQAAAAALVAPADSGRPSATPAEAAPRNPANLAAGTDTLAGAQVRNPVSEPGDPAAAKATERTGDAAQPANNFAAIHAAALANLRGEAPQPAAAPVHLHVATPAGSTAWPEEVGSRVTWMVGHSESHAELTLTPPQLGKVEVSITVSGDQTSAQFVAATPAARELIEQSLPRLREILEQSGISLGQTDVGTSGQPGDTPGDGRRGNNWNQARNQGDGGMASTSAGPWLRRGEGLVDTFA